MYETVLRAQEAAERMIRPGVKFCEIDRTARTISAEAGYGKYFTIEPGIIFREMSVSGSRIWCSSQRTAWRS